MEPTSNPDNARSTHGLARFWSVHHDEEDGTATPDLSPMSDTLSGDTEVVALGSRRLPESAAVQIPVSGPPGLGQSAAGAVSLGGPGGARPPSAAAAPGPAGHPSDGPRPTGVPGPTNSPGPTNLPGSTRGQGSLGANGPLGANSPLGTNTQPGTNSPFGSHAPLGGNETTGADRPISGSGASGGNGPINESRPTGGNKSISRSGADAERGPIGGTGSGPRPVGAYGTASVNGRGMPGPVSGPPASVSGPPALVSGPLGQVSGVPAAAERNQRPDRDSDHSRAAEDTPDDNAPVESGRVNTWDRDFGGFGLGGRNSRFLFGGRDSPHSQPGLNGHGPGEVNGRSTGPDLSAVSGAAGHDDDADDAEPRDENGRADMNGRTGVSGVPTSGAGTAAPVSGPGAGADETTGRRAAPNEAGDPRRAASGWASVPTSTHPIVGPTSAPPVSGAPIPVTPVSGGPVSGGPVSRGPVSGGPVSGGPVFGASYGQPPGYPPALPDPTAGPVSGVPAPRSATSIPVPVAKPPQQQTQPPHDTLRTDPRRDGSPRTDPLGDDPLRDDQPGQGSIRFGVTETQKPAPDDDLGGLSPRRSASLEDAEPARRGRRAAPEEPDDEAHDEVALRPGDIAAGSIAFWDDDATRHFRAAWHEVKAEFVDDPVTALTRAHDLLTDAVNELTEALLAERDELDPLRGNGTPDTESMRMSMRGYREFLDRILSL